jgi:hypothetical protein
MPRSEPRDRPGYERKKSERLNSKKQLNLIASFAAELSSYGLKPLPSAVLLSLAARGLMPSPLEGTSAGRLLERLAIEMFEHEDLQVDQSDLAICLTNPADVDDDGLFEILLLQSTDFDETERQWELFRSIERSFLTPEVRKCIADPLFCGWLYQTILMGRSDYSLSRTQRSPKSLSRITQWFTPEWISEFLLDECFRDRHQNISAGLAAFDSQTFLDSACGAGHILALAFRKLLDCRLSAEPGSGKALSGEPIKNVSESQVDPEILTKHLIEILSKQLYGLDTDPLMVKLSGLAIYLTGRDLSRTAPLPIPLFFSFGSDESESFANHGSLLLSLKPRPADILLCRIDGTRLELSELPERFDRQALNPPYLSHRLMSKHSAKFLREYYDGCQYDYYTAFLELSIRLMKKGGRLSLICQQSFLSTSRFESLRRRLIERCHIHSVVQLGAGAFASRGGEKVSNAIISLSLKQENENGHELSVYKLLSANSKEQAETDGLVEYEKETFLEADLITNTQMIPGFPLVPFCPKEVANLFHIHPTIAQSDNGIILTNGLFTCDNKRFVRHFSEMNDIDRTIYVPYDKGGGQKWFSTTPYMLEWTNNGDDIRSFRHQRGQSKALPGERFYFQHGITYSYIGTKGFKARLLSPGSVFDIASSAIFSEEIDLYYLLGFLNSSLTRYILGMLNPTVNFQIGDLRRLPFCAPEARLEKDVAKLAKEAVELAREAETFDRSSPTYNHALKHASTNARVNSINQAESQLQNAIDKAIFDLYKISSTTRDIINENEWVTSTQVNLIAR